MSWRRAGKNGTRKEKEAGKGLSHPLVYSTILTDVRAWISYTCYNMPPQHYQTCQHLFHIIPVYHHHATTMQRRCASAAGTTTMPAINRLLPPQGRLYLHPMEQTYEHAATHLLRLRARAMIFVVVVPDAYDALANFQTNAHHRRRRSLS